MRQRLWLRAILILALLPMLYACGKQEAVPVRAAPPPPPPPSAAAADNAAWQNAPAFPTPAPKPSGRLEIPSSYLAPAGQDGSLGKVSDKLVAALSAAGYSDYTFMPAGDGFALVTQLEKIRSDGSPDLHQRFDVSLSDTARRYFSLGDYIKALFSADVAHYRVVVFLVTAHTIAFSKTGATSDQVQQWGGFDRLPSEVAATAYDPATGWHCVALVYEFAKDQFGSPAAQSLPGSVSAQQHLEKAGILAKLEQ